MQSLLARVQRAEGIRVSETTKIRDTICDTGLEAAMGIGATGALKGMERRTEQCGDPKSIETKRMQNIHVRCQFIRPLCCFGTARGRGRSKSGVIYQPTAENVGAGIPCR